MPTKQPTQQRLSSESKAAFRRRAFALALTSLLALTGQQVSAQPQPDAQDQAEQTTPRFLVKWRAPTTLANGSPFKGQGLTGFKIYGSKTRYDMAPSLLLRVKDPDATSARVPLSSGEWYLWVSATTAKGESELQYNSKVISP